MNTGLKERLRVIAETADAALLEQPLRSLEDLEAIERVPLEERLKITDFCRRMDVALAAHDPAETAISYVPDGDVEREPEVVSFGELRSNIARTAALLRANGVGRSDVVAILTPATPAIYWSVLGALQAGVVFPLNWMLEPPYMLHLLREAGVKAVIALGPTPGFKIWESLMSIAGELPGVKIWSVQGPDGTLLPDSDLDLAIAGQDEAKGAIEPTEGEAIAAFVHSGGTTGLPKIVKLSHRALSYRHWTGQIASQYTLGEVNLHDSPMFHTGGFMGRLLPPMASGASVVIPSIWGARDKTYIANYWRFVERYRVSRLSGVPTTLAVLSKSSTDGADLSSLKPFFMTGSSPLPASVRRDFEAVSGVRVLNSYGMTENTASIAMDPRDGVRKEGSSGMRLPYTRIRAVAVNAPDIGKRICGPNEIGMLQITSPGLTSGYVNPAHEKGARTEDGWLITGDLGRIDEDGRIFITGRPKDVIIRGGHNIDPALIEDPLLQLPDVLHAAAVGKPDSYAGELPVVYVQLLPGSKRTEAELLAHLSSCIMERAAMPKEVFIVEHVPLTDVGKPSKVALRMDAAERVFRAVLSEATGLSAADGRLAVEVRSHATKGTEIAVGLAGVAPADRAATAAAVEKVMEGYPFAHVVEWRD
ncbi:MAG TPA: acyl-CoA synthetase [Caulobacteraceae bacterium]|jgi:fatty-acyl-CoA synthase|nr:acyl-CoA synthetase [Caulobacteraceae bacterium]